MTKKFQQAKEMLVTDLEVVKVMSDPLRVQVLEAMVGEPITVKQVATAVGVPQSKLYYHVGLLEKHGLIAVVDTQVVSGIVEKWYQAVAASFRIDRRLFKAEGGGGDSAYDLISTVFDSTAAEIRRAFEKGVIRVEDDSPEVERMMLSRTHTFLTPEQVVDFYARFSALLTEFNDCGETSPTEGKRAYALTIALYPFDASAIMPPQAPDETDD